MLTLRSKSRANLVATAAICAALYAIVNALTSLVSTPFGIGEFRPGVVIPTFFAIVAGPIPAAIGAGVGSFVGDMISLVPEGRSNVIWALFAGGLGNFLGILVLGWIYQKLKNWKGFVTGTTVGLFVGNLVAAGLVVLLGIYFVPTSTINPFPNLSVSLNAGFMIGLLLFWFGTMFPFVIILVPPIVRVMRPYASKLVGSGEYPEISRPGNKFVWGWSILVSALVLAALGVALLGGVAGVTDVISVYGGSARWVVLFLVSAAAVLAVGALLPSAARKQTQTPSASSSVN